MIRTAPPFPRPPRSHELSQPDTKAENRSGGPHVAYGSPFWMAYASTTLAMAAVALLFRYADFITLLGGTEFHLGWIVGVGMIGSLAMRLSMGSCIDHYGTKVVWLGSTLLFAATCFAHLAISSHTGVAIYLLRIVFCCAVAGFYGAAMTFVSKRAPAKRMAELAGMLGTASFLGTVLGTMLGDLLLKSVAVDRTDRDDVRCRRSDGTVFLSFCMAGDPVGDAACSPAPFAFARSVARTPPRRRAGGWRGDGHGREPSKRVPMHVCGGDPDPSAQPVLCRLRHCGCCREDPHSALA